MRVVEASLKESDSIDNNKKVLVLSLEALLETNQKILRNDPNMSGRIKLAQLERHEWLHRLHENANLHKQLLSYHFLCVYYNLMKLLSWIGSDMTKDVAKPSVENLPELPLRLEKMPKDVVVGSDKGFEETGGELSNVNDVITPMKVKNSNTHRLYST